MAFRQIVHGNTAEKRASAALNMGNLFECELGHSGNTKYIQNLTCILVGQEMELYFVQKRCPGSVPYITPNKNMFNSLNKQDIWPTNQISSQTLFRCLSVTPTIPFHFDVPSWRYRLGLLIPNTTFQKVRIWIWFIFSKRAVSWPGLFASKDLYLELDLFSPNI